ncbi:three-helix bundle dimerization domain-containing protein [Mycobacterium sp. 1465703.0]|uniref:three-helix bundle dimerization domain-containing protein n=1 Tax=Mycobacterium sp. 1465703.0 TaxID=1834078 RepID=UPI003516CF98
MALACGRLLHLPRMPIYFQRTGGSHTSSVPKVMGVPQEERAQIDAVQRRLAQKFAEVPRDDIAGIVQREYQRFKQSKLRDFIPLLVERRAGEHLVKCAIDCGPEAEADGSVLNGDLLDPGHVANGAGGKAPNRWRLSLGARRLATGA